MLPMHKLRIETIRLVGGVQLPQLDPWAFTGIIIIAGMLFQLLITPAPQAADQAAQLPAVPPVIIVATPTPGAAGAQLVANQAAELPAELPAGAERLGQAVIAYDAPQGNPMDALDTGRAFVRLASSGPGWVQIRLVDGPDVWVQASKLPGWVPDIATAIPTAAPPAPERSIEYVTYNAPADQAPAQAPQAAPELPADQAAPVQLAEATAAPQAAPQPVAEGCSLPDGSFMPTMFDAAGQPIPCDAPAPEFAPGEPMFFDEIGRAVVYWREPPVCGPGVYSPVIVQLEGATMSMACRG